MGQIAGHTRRLSVAVGKMRILENRRNLLLLTIGAGVIAGVFVLAIGWSYRDMWWPRALQAWLWLWAHLQTTHPIAFFSAFVLLTAVGCPITIFYLAAPGLYPFWVCFAYAVVGLGLHFVLTFWIANSIFRPVLERLLRMGGFEIPQLKPNEYAKVTVAVRVTPGLPFIVQNYMLALAGVPFKTFMTISWIANLGWALAFLSLGESIFEGEAGFAVFAVLLIIGLTIITKLIRDRYASRDEPIAAR